MHVVIKQQKQLRDSETLILRVKNKKTKTPTTAVKYNTRKTKKRKVRKKCVA